MSSTSISANEHPNRCRLGGTSHLASVTYVVYGQPPPIYHPYFPGESTYETVEAQLGRFPSKCFSFT